ncbi:hypothetical protein JI435_302700, partial [Parastagonospora nodorum SN15]
MNLHLPRRACRVREQVGSNTCRAFRSKCEHREPHIRRDQPSTTIACDVAAGRPFFPNSTKHERRNAHHLRPAHCADMLASSIAHIQPSAQATANFRGLEQSDAVLSTKCFTRVMQSIIVQISRSRY